MPVIAVFNQKGGVGKTTTTLNVGAGLLKRNQPSLLIDGDPQSSLTVAMGLRSVAASAVALGMICVPVWKLAAAADSNSSARQDADASPEILSMLKSVCASSFSDHPMGAM